MSDLRTAASTLATLSSLGEANARVFGGEFFGYYFYFSQKLRARQDAV